MAKRKGYPQSLDNGVMNRPTSHDTKARSSRSLNFAETYGLGENPNGQTTLAPDQVVREGVCQYERQWHWGKGTDGERFNGNPMPKSDKKDDPYK